MPKQTSVIPVKITIRATIAPEFKDELERIVDHHIEYLIDLISYPEIKSVYGCEIETDKEDNQ